MDFNHISSILNNINLKISSINKHTTSVSQAELYDGIALDIIQELLNLKHQLNLLDDNKLQSLHANLQELENSIINTPSDQVKKIKQEIKDTKQELSIHKRDKSAIKQQILESEKNIKEIQKQLKSTANKHKAESKKIENENKLLEQRHNLGEISFEEFNPSKTYTQHDFIKTNRNFKVFNTQSDLADEITECFKAKTFGNILEELSLCLGLDEKHILIIYKGTIKYNFNPAINEQLKALNCIYNQKLKSWYIPFDKFGYTENKLFNEFLSNTFQILIDLDNLLIYKEDEFNLTHILNKKREFEKINYLKEQVIFNKKSADELVQINPDLEVVFNQPKGISVFDPTIKQFTPFKTNTNFKTIIPILLIRSTRQGTQYFYLIDIRTGKILNPNSIDRSKRTQFIYRAQLHKTDPEDFFEI